MNKKVVGYTTGVYDLFHIGHLNILKRAKEECDFLIVGVTNDAEVKRVKGIEPFIPFEERFKIIEALKYVDQVVEESSVDKIEAWKILDFDILFKGDDWKNSSLFTEYEKFFKEHGVEIKFFPYTKGTSSTMLRSVLKNNLKE